ncbi:MAG: hypothetical protein IJ151_04215 [Bacteroidales bacterium]|nr:hypothetical protein [Bacteroidales bacterium]
MAALASCSKGGADVPGFPEDGAPREVLIPAFTKAASTVVPEFDVSDATSLRTFRTVLLNTDYPWRKYEAQGTYCNIYQHPEASDRERWYHPIHCDDSGNPLTDSSPGTGITSWTKPSSTYLANGSVPEYTKDASGETWGNSKYGLWAASPEAYRLVMVSPARKLTRYLLRDSEGNPLEDAEINYRYGIHQLRKNDEVLISPCTPVSLRGTYLAHFNKGYQYVYKPDFDNSDSADDDDLTLLDHRSQLSVKTYVDEALDHVHINKIVLSNTITEGIYLPIDEVTGNPRWIYDWDGTAHIFENTGMLTVDEYGDDSNYALKSDVVLHYKNDSGQVNDPIDVFSNYYLLSQNYSELNAKGLAVHPVPKLNVFLLSDLEEETSVEIPLSWNFQPQHHYHLTLRISTWYLYVYVKGSNWDDEAEEDFAFGMRPDIIIRLDNPLISGANWDDGGSHDGTI